MTESLFVGIHELAEQTGLPVAWLKREAEAGRIHNIQIGRRRFFNTAIVLKELTERQNMEYEATHE